MRERSPLPWLRGVSSGPTPTNPHAVIAESSVTTDIAPFLGLQPLLRARARVPSRSRLATTLRPVPPQRVRSASLTLDIPEVMELGRGIYVMRSEASNVRE